MGSPVRRTLAGFGRRTLRYAAHAYLEATSDSVVEYRREDIDHFCTRFRQFHDTTESRQRHQNARLRRNSTGETPDEGGGYARLRGCRTSLQNCLVDRKEPCFSANFAL